MSYNYLKFIDFNSLDSWSVKRYIVNNINSKYKLVKLSYLIKERSKKVKLFKYPEKEFGILGVNNKDGLFDAYAKKGKNINQPYKKVYNGDLAYNPYRINVGSIGLKTDILKNNFISPAYVVFYCNNKLKPAFLYKMFKTETFNKIINDNTTGSVRQNLKFDSLANIRIPLPSIQKQEQILKEYNDKISLAKRQEEEAKNLENEIEEYLFNELGIEKIEEKKEIKGYLHFVEFKDLDRWDTQYLIGNKPLIKSIYPLEKFSNIITNFNKNKNGKSIRINPNYYPNKKFLYIGMEHIEKETGNLLNKNFVYGKDIKSQSLQVPQNFILYGKLRPYLSKYWLNNLPCDDIICSAEFFVFDISKTVDKNYFINCLSSKFTQLQINDKTSGARMPRINESIFKNLVFPLPPLEIQEKIANEITKKKEKIKQLKQEAQKNRKLAIKEFHDQIF